MPAPDHEQRAATAVAERATPTTSEILRAQRRLLTRRGVLAGGVGLAATAFLAACGGGDDDDDTGTAVPTGTTAVAAATATVPAATATTAVASPTTGAAADAISYPFTMQDDLGEVTIPAEPQRILAMYDVEPLDVLAAVGVKPVWCGMTNTYDVALAPWISESDLDGADTPETLDFSEPDAEQYATADPDLILATWLEDVTVAQLAGFAPTVVLKAAETTDWRQVQRYAGQAINRVQESEDAIAETERVLDEQAARLAPYADRSVTIAYQWNGGINVHGGNIVIGTILTRLGMTVAAPDPDEVTVLSLERWSELADADVLLSMVFVADDMLEQEADPLFRTLPAIAGGRYIVLDQPMARAMYLESALSVRWVASRLADALIEAAEGRGREVE